MTILDFAWLIPAFPAVSFAVLVFFGAKLKQKSAYISIGAVAISVVLSSMIFLKVADTGEFGRRFLWLPMGESWLSMGFLLDNISVMMLLVVSFIGMLIQIYSIGYMHGDIRYSRFFAYLSLFTAAMLNLVISDNLLTFYISWELVGLCSYLLIGFWFERPAAARAAKKAFLVTRLGDVGLFLGLLLLYFHTGEIAFHEVFGAIHNLSPAILTLTGILIFAGAAGKSAQFPLHVWLPDAMEGPTPVSALIHAATMVAAGVYLVARTYPVFHWTPHSVSLQVVAYTGVITALMAAGIAVITNDIKRILAYSTISQLGYMMLALGAGGYSAGLFHLMTHAFFKALLFLGSGSIIHAAHTQDIWEMGGLRKKMPVTFWTFLLGTLALAGIPPFSGFFSKDEILAEVYQWNRIVFLLGLAGAFLTAFYMFRLCFVVFFGSPRKESHAHESPNVMTVPLIILAFFAVTAGWVGTPFSNHAFQHFIHFGEGHVPEMNFLVMGLSIFSAFAGILMAWLMYHKKVIGTAVLKEKLSPVYIALKNKFWMDELYVYGIVNPGMKVAGWFFKFDQRVIDGFVNLSGRGTVVFSNINRWIDNYIVDGLVNASGFVTRTAGTGLRYIQTGIVQNYILVVFLGLVLLLLIGYGK